MIGACTKMQTLSLEEEFSLLQGIPYDLDIFSDFSAWQLKGSGIQDVSTSDLCRMLVETENTVEANAIDSQPTTEISYQESLQIQKAIKKALKESREEDIWEEKHNKIDGKKAIKNWKRAVRSLGVDPDDL